MSLLGDAFIMRMQAQNMMLRTGFVQANIGIGASIGIGMGFVGGIAPEMLLLLLMMLMMMQGRQCGMCGGYPMPMPMPMPTPMPMPMPVPYPVPVPVPRPIPYPVPTPVPRPVPPTPVPVRDVGTLIHNKNQNVYITPGGWKVIQQGSTVKLISPDGKTTKIWGDPHVKEADGSKWQWKTKNATFVLPDGTKITMNATGPGGVVTGLDIYTAGHGDHVHINARNNQVSRSFNRYANIASDYFQADGATYVTNNSGKDWHVIYNEKAPGQYDTHVKDRDYKKAENWHQRWENFVDTLKRNGGKIAGYSAIGSILGALGGPVGMGIGALIGGLVGYFS